MQLSNLTWLKLYNETGGCCFYCHKELEDERICVDHVIPKNEGGTNSRDNLVISCRSCNSAKGTKSVTLFLKQKSINDFLKENYSDTIKVLLQKDGRYTITGVITNLTPKILLDISQRII